MLVLTQRLRRVGMTIEIEMVNTCAESDTAVLHLNYLHYANSPQA